MTNLAKTKPRVILTRVAGLEQKSVLALKKAGFDCENIPLIAIEKNSQAQKELKNLDLSSYSKIILISPNAASLFVDALKNTQKPLALTLKKAQIEQNLRQKRQWLFFAVGAQTCKVLHSIGLDCAYPKGGDKAENLLDFLASEFIGINKTEKILILKGEGGRDFLIPNLQKLGAWVDSIDLYKRKKPKLSATQVSSLFKKDLFALVINSQTALENLKYFMQRAKNTDSFVPNLLVSSERLVIKAGNLGFKNIINTQTVSITSVINKLNELKSCK